MGLFDGIETAKITEDSVEVGSFGSEPEPAKELQHPYKGIIKLNYNGMWSWKLLKRRTDKLLVGVADGETKHKEWAFEAIDVAIRADLDEDITIYYDEKGNRIK